VRIEDRRVKASYLGLHAEVSRTGSKGLLGDRPRPCEPSSAPGGDRERLLRRDDAPVKSVRSVGTGVPNDAAGTGGGIDNQLGARAEHAPPWQAPVHPARFHLAIRSMWQALGCVPHNRDRQPYSEPSEQLFPVAAPKHPIRRHRGFKFGVAPMLVHHQVSGTEDIQIREHDVSLGSQNKMQAKRRLVRDPV